MANELADLVQAQNSGYEFGAKQAQPNGLGIFIKTMLAQQQKNLEEVNTAKVGVYKDVVKGSVPSTMTYNDPATGKVSTYTANSGYSPELTKSAYEGLGIQQPSPTQPASTQPVDNTVAGNQTTPTTQPTNVLPAGASVISSGGKTTIKPPASNAAITERKQNAKDIADGIMSGITPVDPAVWGGMAGKAEVSAELSRRGFDYNKAYTDWVATKRMILSLNSPQQMRLRQAILSVDNSIPILRDVSKELERTGFVPANKLIIGAKLNGIQLKNTQGMNDNQVNAATKYVTQMNAMRDELAQAFSGGYAPTEAAFKLADDILKPSYSNPQLNSALDQLSVNLKIRLNATEYSNPISLGGEIGSSYNQSPIPGMDQQTQGNNLTNLKSKYGLN